MPLSAVEGRALDKAARSSACVLASSAPIGQAANGSSEAFRSSEGGAAAALPAARRPRSAAVTLSQSSGPRARMSAWKSCSGPLADDAAALGASAISAATSNGASLATLSAPRAASLP